MGDLSKIAAKKTEQTSQPAEIREQYVKSVQS